MSLVCDFSLDNTTLFTRVYNAQYKYLFVPLICPTGQSTQINVVAIVCCSIFWSSHSVGQCIAVLFSSGLY